MLNTKILLVAPDLLDNTGNILYYLRAIADSYLSNHIMHNVNNVDKIFEKLY
jgi:hypothetical protein